jgi:hypothetical protein
MQLDLVEIFYNCATIWTSNSLFLSLKFEMSCRSLNAQQNEYCLSLLQQQQQLEEQQKESTAAAASSG